ncbi:MAG TPA: hypothetical protein VMR44_07975 [Thermoanaerobaculia bacterium]|nr:hypothetical protein [Thermoanaerobaculia bacterium]
MIAIIGPGRNGLAGPEVAAACGAEVPVGPFEATAYEWLRRG